METNTSRTTSRKSPRRTAKQSSQESVASEDLRERIARRAYAIYEGRVRQGPLDDWLQAEREVLGIQQSRES